KAGAREPRSEAQGPDERARGFAYFCQDKSKSPQGETAISASPLKKNPNKPLKTTNNQQPTTNNQQPI
ncbi:hypothetical protein N5C45_12495, partial [Pseudomonas mosselii]|uniref:hypothetical protein n=1 Tax=Pseudomonas mosselii TaxID=78327 RepID=UPI00244C4AC8